MGVAQSGRDWFVCSGVTQTRRVVVVALIRQFVLNFPQLSLTPAAIALVHAAVVALVSLQPGSTVCGAGAAWGTGASCGVAACVGQIKRLVEAALIRQLVLNCPQLSLAPAATTLVQAAAVALVLVQSGSV